MGFMEDGFYGRIGTHSSSKSEGRIPEPFLRAWKDRSNLCAAVYSVPSHQLSFDFCTI